MAAVGGGIAIVIAARRKRSSAEPQETELTPDEQRALDDLQK